MKTKSILLWIALAAIGLCSCANKEPFDTQLPNDAPRILKPYNESYTGSFTYVLANPETPLVDSVVVTPSRYTTVNWYVNDVLVHTGTKINMCFPAGKHSLLIEAVTTMGKRAERRGTITVHSEGASSAENILWEGPVALRYDAERVKVTAQQMADVPTDATIRIYFEKLPDGDVNFIEDDTHKYNQYYSLRITTPNWGTPATLETDLVLQQNMGDEANPFSFIYDERCKRIVETNGAMSVVGWGLSITKITYE